MAQFFDSPTRPDIAAAAIAQHLRVKTTGALALAGASDVSIGTMENICTAAGPCTVRLASAQGTRKMVASGAFVVDAVLYAAAGGKVDDSGTVVEGRAMSASSGDGDVVEVMSLGANTLDAGTVTETGTQTLSNKTLTAPVIGVATGTSLAVTGLIRSSSATAGIGYATGAGAAVTQGTDRTTTVVCTGLSGAITTTATSLATAAEVSFTVTNSSVAIGDVVIANIRSGPTTSGSTQVSVTAVAAGSFQLTLNNLHASTADTGAAVINFAVIKAVSA